MQSLRKSASVIIDNGAEMPAGVVIEQDVEMVRSDRATKPDPRWSTVDDAGHFHAYTQGGDLPTLVARSEQAPCDGSCGGVCGGEGYTITSYFCRICEQEIEPAVIPDEEARTVGVPLYGRKSATLTVGSGMPLDTAEKVSLRVRLGDEELIGIGQIANAEGSGGPHGFQMTYTIIADQLEPRLTP